MKQYFDFSENELIKYIKNRDLCSAAVVVLDVLYPFSRIIAFSITIAEPMLQIFIDAENIGSGRSFFEDKSRISDLKRKLLEEN